MFELESGNDEFHQLRGHNSEVSWMIWLVIELDLDIMLISIMTKFGEDPIRIVRVRERKP